MDNHADDAVRSLAHRSPVTLRTLNKMAQAGEPFACLTCYDATMARLLDRAGVHVLLVGDTAAEVVLGFDRTIHMPLDLAVALTAAVKRGARGAVVMADMPFLSYHTGEDEAVRNAGRFMTEGLADVVKVEADATAAGVVSRMAAAGIPVCAHVGSRPQRASLTGGYAAAGRSSEEARSIIEDAVALEKAGAIMLLAEAVPDEVTRGILRLTRVPLIGIGAGTACHGQVLVIQDLLGIGRSAAVRRAVAALGVDHLGGPGVGVADVATRIGGERCRVREGGADRLGAWFAAQDR